MTGVNGMQTPLPLAVAHQTSVAPSFACEWLRLLEHTAAGPTATTHSHLPSAARGRKVQGYAVSEGWAGVLETGLLGLAVLHFRYVHSQNRCRLGALPATWQIGPGYHSSRNACGTAPLPN